MKFLLSLLLTIILFLGVIIGTHACALPESSTVYFKPFSTQTYLPVSKKDFQGERMVIKNAFFKKSKTSGKAGGLKM
ncbi:MAG: hypothetical protein QX199_05730 [Methylococcaceae bacterium]